MYDIVVVQIRRKIPAPGGAHTLSYGSVAEGSLAGVREKQLQMANTIRTLHSKCSQRASSLTGERERERGRGREREREGERERERERGGGGGGGEVGRERGRDRGRGREILGSILPPDGEHLTGGELDEFVKQVVTTGPLQEAGPQTLPPKDILRYNTP